MTYLAEHTGQLCLSFHFFMFQCLLVVILKLLSMLTAQLTDRGADVLWRLPDGSGQTGFSQSAPQSPIKTCMYIYIYIYIYIVDTCLDKIDIWTDRPGRSQASQQMRSAN